MNSPCDAGNQPQATPARVIELPLRREIRPLPGGDRAVPPAHGDEDELFRCHHRALVRSVSRSVNASHELIEDACQDAWLVLLRLQPERTPGLFAWLRTVAIHQAYRMSRRESRQLRLEDLMREDGWERRLSGAHCIDDAIEARWALALLAALPVLQRQDLTLLVGGYSYREIAQHGGAGARSTNNVNKRLTKARARMRRLQAA